MPPRDAFRTFSNDVEKTLYILAGSLRGTGIRPGDLPDLREDHHALLREGDPRQGRYALVNIETDRVTNSLEQRAARTNRIVALVIHLSRYFSPALRHRLRKKYRELDLAAHGAAPQWQINNLGTFVARGHALRSTFSAAW